MLQWSHQHTCCSTPFIRKSDLGQKGNHILSFVIYAIAVCVKLCTKLSVFGRIFQSNLISFVDPLKLHQRNLNSLQFSFWDILFTDTIVPVILYPSYLTVFLDALKGICQTHYLVRISSMELPVDWKNKSKVCRSCRKWKAGIGKSAKLSKVFSKTSSSDCPPQWVI